MTGDLHAAAADPYRVAAERTDRQRAKDIVRMLDPAEIRDIKAREDREGRPYSDRDMLLDHVDALAARVTVLEDALRRFVEAWWEYDRPDFEPLDGAASEGIAVLGDVISLVSSGPEADASSSFPDGQKDGR